MNHKDFFFNQSNTKLYGSYFKPKNIKAVIVLIHGMGEYFGRYVDHVIPHFYKNSIAVIAYDQFGHGKTEGKRGHNPGFEEVLDCVTVVINKSKEVFGNKQTFLYGHSMGGNVVINYVLRRKHHLKGVIATSPFLKLAFEPPAWKLKIAKALLKIAPSLTMDNELDVNAVSRDTEEVEKYKKDLLIHDKVSPNYSIVFIETGQWALDNASKLKIPMLLMHGTGDELTNFKASKEFAKNAGSSVTLKLYDGAYHELHNDIIKNDVLDEMTSWLNKEIKS
jgi:alpha-beta hydrolase superfamily lysophospholipase